MLLVHIEHSGMILFVETTQTNTIANVEALALFEVMPDAYKNGFQETNQRITYNKLTCQSDE